jgi:putative transposase
MARPLRIQFSGAVYHVINRGTARQATFLQKEDSEAFLKTLAEAMYDEEEKMRPGRWRCI